MVKQLAGLHSEQTLIMFFRIVTIQVADLELFLVCNSQSKVYNNKKKRPMGKKKDANYAVIKAFLEAGGFLRLLEQRKEVKSLMK